MQLKNYQEVEKTGNNSSINTAVTAVAPRGTTGAVAGEEHRKQ